MFCQLRPYLAKRTPLSLRHARSFSINPKYMGAVRGWGTIANIAAGAYIGGLFVCLGSLYFVYYDAESRQHIPFELPFGEQYTAVKAISKDDVLKSPRYAVKHYRRLLIDLALQADPELQFSETLPDGSRNYAVPLLSSDTLVYHKTPEFANFYIDMVLRYAKALLAKGQLDTSVAILKHIVDDDEIFYKLGDAERMSQCCRMLSKVSSVDDEKSKYLERGVNMLAQTFSSVKLQDNLLQEGSRITDELILALNALAFTYARQSASAKGKTKQQLLSKSLNIYLANLKSLSEIKSAIDSGERTQASFPLFNCDPENLQMTCAEIKAHISEILWAKGYKKNAVAWGEEVVEEIYFDHNNVSRASPILLNVLDNLATMYDQLHDKKSKQRCEGLKHDLQLFEGEQMSWYDSVVNRFTKIIYYKGPLGILEKALKERFGQPERIPDIEEYEDEDEEV
ncbi:hypothetical protein EJF18_40375 [Clavispora lusitaniae]|uniref:Uncharacterized protein n=3 Tax=Clavispora lusitaniae TaxID=36911 RepID=C4Y5Z4_CLAL4|nr:uncharacterized protein CLUG_03578 [Clavispora lusitaniae ATCC 42720]KAF7582579.1 hypothetical protein FOB63_002660 [Clavispora lusitaniae]EEQ39450.1 hypothetical protein CLUG_03578 [Clavispora lusitaniae ATCC 42720]OVF11124.1 hypothetical protein A9F13_01g05885 [Clavispora lusitaniae]QFZ28339.1 hypothetical protein EJF14_40375 [Clavispora lusitaniae]QFZ34002.1 hypothetical protein EJF16_40375 [Clavispora lusitaniae]